MVGTAQLSQPNVPDVSANLHGPSERMDLVAALFLDVRRRWIKLVVKALSASSGSLLFALLAPRTETGAEPATREAHGLRPNSCPVPSRT